jgi:glycogenin glucosyltransferase
VPSEPSAQEENDPVTSTIPANQSIPADPWQTFQTSGNAWDNVPEIERYIGALQKNRKGNIQVLQGYGSGIAMVSSPGARRPSMKLTDFPTELERPSLPVTPAPIRRPSFWGEERDEAGELPQAEGVPTQAEWVIKCPNCGSVFPVLNNLQDPAAQLDMLARRQSDVLANKLGQGEGGREIPMRSLPYGSEGVRSPTYVPQGPSGSSTVPGAQSTQEQPSFTGRGPVWEKDETFPSHSTPLGGNEAELDALS